LVAAAVDQKPVIHFQNIRFSKQEDSLRLQEEMGAMAESESPCSNGLEEQHLPGQSSPVQSRSGQELIETQTPEAAKPASGKWAARDRLQLFSRETGGEGGEEVEQAWGEEER